MLGIRRFSVAGGVALLLALPGAAQAQHGSHHGGGHSSHHRGGHGTHGHHGSSHYGGGRHFGHLSFHFHSYGYYPFYSYPWTVMRRYSIAPGRIVQVEDVLERGESVSPEDLGTEDRQWSGPPSSRRQELGRLRVEVTPRDVSVYLDGRFVGTGEELAAAPDLRMKPGEHLLEVVRPGYETQTRRFTVTPGDSLNQQLELDQR